LLLKIVIYGWALVGATLVVYSYVGVQWTEVLVFSVSDGWCDVESQGLGRHCFGDFGILHAVDSQSLYLEPNVAGRNPPFVNLLGLFSQNVHYNWGLLITLLSMIALQFEMLRRATVLLSPLERAVCQVFLGLLAFGSIASLDRGNLTLLVSPMIYFFCVSIVKERYLSASFLIGLMFALKFWAVIFLLAFFAKRKWRYVAISSANMCLVTLLPLFFFEGNLKNKLENIVLSVLDREYGAFLAQFSTSLFSLILKIECLIDWSGCQPGRLPEGIPFAAGLAVLLFSFLSFISVLSITFWKSNHFLGYLPLITMVFLALPEAQLYNLSVMSTLTALYFWQNQEKVSGNLPHTFRQRRQEVFTKAVLVGIAVTSLPIAFYVGFVLPSAENLRLPTVYAPLLWFPLVVAGTILGAAQREEKIHPGNHRTF
jgi:hypothetical protein